ncbi:hypothetical protein K431DRAFT_309845 [Polychaeton citri CBS 116435]|uniref:Phosphoribosylaminoimidazole-succinocarboxamide synthase n=1 Tax=Polychaeton citri CBS 116435 TaxID=1314669 RepID=A0A9P4QFJ9_9PEZI|nr:hypothetical protein K431DRAFT_309845 [Polychaeton citri CBS 116435]
MSAQPTLSIDPYTTRHVNVSSPSVVHRKESEQSITASEDYYSLSSSSNSIRTVSAAHQQSSLTIARYATPPSQYRTPLQSSTNLGRYPSREHAIAAATVAAPVEERKTPMRGFGKRRESLPAEDPPYGGSDVAIPEPSRTRDAAVKRKPVPSTVIEMPSPDQTPTQRDYSGRRGVISSNYEVPDSGYVAPNAARSSMARAIDRETDAPTPDVDDTPYIHFALDQLTRDEEVHRESRLYPGQGRPAAASSSERDPFISSKGQRDVPGAYPVRESSQRRSEQYSQRPQSDYPARYEAVSQQEESPPVQREVSIEPPPRDPRRPFSQPIHGDQPGNLAAGAGGLAAVAAAAGLPPPPSASQRQLQEMPSSVGLGAPDLFIHVDPSSGLHQPLTFLPGILRPLWLGLFCLFTLICTVLLIVAAGYSAGDTGLWYYGTIGDGRYFAAQYLPTLIGAVLLVWLWQVELALHRTLPFIAMASDDVNARQQATSLPLIPREFMWPVLVHWRIPQMKIPAAFFLVAWPVHIFILPLLASSFNVYFYGTPGRWRWIATQGVIWPAVALCVFLLVASIALLFWLRNRRSGLLWDPRSLADAIVLLERSNALDGILHHEPAKLGYWRTAARPNEVFHGYGVSNKNARRYSIEDGRIREKLSVVPPEQRYSDQSVDLEAGGRNNNGGRTSRDAMRPILPRHNRGNSGVPADESGFRTALPWFLRPVFALLWPVIAIVLLLAFLIVSYLSSTRLTVDGFLPRVGNSVDRAGFSATNFLYSFIPAFLANLCLLCWISIDLAYRRLQPLAALVDRDGQVAEKSILASYAADLPIAVTISSLINGHLRVAIFSFVTLIAATLPILAGGCFWALFYVPLQETRVSIHFAAFYALTVFTSLYAAAYILVWPSKDMRRLELPNGGNANTFAGIMALVKRSRLLDDLAFHSPRGKVELVTRLLSSNPGAPLGMSLQAPGQGGNAAQGNGDVAASRVSLADSIRGFGRARQHAQASEAAGAQQEKQTGRAANQVARFGLGRHDGRDGREFWGLDRVNRET